MTRLMSEVKVVWDLTKPLPDRKSNEEVVVKPVGKDQLREIGKIQMVTWGGFVKDPEATVKWLGPKIDAGIVQPFIAYLEGKLVGTVSVQLDRQLKSGRLYGGVHVLPEYRRQRIGTALLLTALRWMRDQGMQTAWVIPWNPESQQATERAKMFYLASGGTISKI